MSLNTDVIKLSDLLSNYVANRFKIQELRTKWGYSRFHAAMDEIARKILG